MISHDSMNANGILVWLQLVAARADTDHWKRRAGVLFLKMSSVQEDADMYSMRCKLLEAEVTRESQHTRSLKVYMLLRYNDHFLSRTRVSLCYTSRDDPTEKNIWLQSKAVSLYQTLAACQQQLLESQHAGQVLQVDPPAFFSHHATVVSLEVIPASVVFQERSLQP